MKFLPGTLHARLVLLIILATMPSLGVLFGYVWQAQARSILQTEQKTQSAIEILAASQKELIMGTKGYLQRLSGFDEIQTPGDPACSDFLRKALRLSGSYVNFGVPLPNGDLLCNAQPMLGKVNVADQGYFQQSLRTKEFAIGDFQIDRTAKQASMNFAYPVLDPQSGEVKGVAVAAISLDEWSRKLAEVDLPDGAIAIVTDGNGTIIAHHPANSRAIGLSAETYGFDFFQTQDGTQPSSGRKQREGAAESMIFAQRALFPSLGHPSISVGVGLPYGEAITTSKQNFWRGVLIIVVAAAFMLALVTWAIHESVSRPLNRLLSYTESLESGSPTRAPKLQGALELKSLQARIVSMGETHLAMESALRQSEARFRQIAETIHEVFWIVSPDWKQVIYVNPVFEQVWQMSAETIYREPRSWIDAVVPEDKPGVLEYIDRVGSLGYTNIIFPVYRIERRDGTVRWISAKGFPVYNEEGEVANIVSIAEDVTERMQYEAELSEREAKYRLLVEHAEDLIVRMDTQGRFLFASPSYCRTFGKSEHQLLGKAFVPMVHEEDQAATEEAMKALYYPPFTAYVEQRAMTVQGWRWFGWSNASVVNEDGKVVEIIGVGRDITRQKRAEFALRESETRYRELVDNMSDGVVVYQRAHEGGGFIIKEINQAAERITHCKREEVVGHHVSEVFPGVMELGLLDVFERVADGGGPIHHPATQYRDERIAIWVENYVFRLPCGEVVAVFQDLTAEKQALVETEATRTHLQRDLVRTNRLEALGRFAGVMAHDFNNLLGAIAGFTELSMARVGSVEPQQIRKYLMHSQESAERAKQLLQQLLIFSRGPDMQVATPQDFTQVVDHALEKARGFLPASIELEVNIEGGPYKVNCDPTHIDRVLINLCINAREAMGEKGKIRIEVGSYDGLGAHCEICAEPITGRWVSLSVADSGSGIAETAKDKIFEPFFTTKDGEKGAGLGLSVVRGIVFSYGGHVLLSSDAENGTCFRLLFPFYTGVEPEPEEIKADERGLLAQADLRGLKVMVVDDELSIRHLFLEALGRAGCDVHVTGDGEEALRQLLEVDQRFDVLVTDQTMPYMTGVELVRHLREQGSELPIILCSGYSDLISNELMNDLKIAHCLEKPVRIEELLTTLRRVVAQANTVYSVSSPN